MLCCGDHLNSFVSDVARCECALKELSPVPSSAYLTAPRSHLTPGLQNQGCYLRLQDCQVDTRQISLSNGNTTCVVFHCHPEEMRVWRINGTQGTACIVLVSALTGLLDILKLSFQRRDLDVRLLDETLNDVRMFVSVLDGFRANFVEI